MSLEHGRVHEQLRLVAERHQPPDALWYRMHHDSGSDDGAMTVPVVPGTHDRLVYCFHHGIHRLDPVVKTQKDAAAVLWEHLIDTLVVRDE